MRSFQRHLNKFAVGVQNYRKLLNENKMLREKIANGDSNTKYNVLYKKLAYNETFLHNHPYRNYRRLKV